MTPENKRLIGFVLTPLLLLLIPFIAMQFTREVHWSLFDFVVAAVLLSGTGSLIELVMRKVKKTGHRIAICLGIVTALVLIWAELAVGIFGTPLAGT